MSSQAQERGEGFSRLLRLGHAISESGDEVLWRLEADFARTMHVTPGGSEVAAGSQGDGQLEGDVGAIGSELEGSSKGPNRFVEASLMAEHLSEGEMGFDLPRILGERSLEIADGDGGVPFERFDLGQARKGARMLRFEGERFLEEALGSD